MKAVQVRCQSDTKQLTCWVDRLNVKVGNIITLKAFPGEMWRVLHVGQPQDRENIHTDWKVGGITTTSH